MNHVLHFVSIYYHYIPHCVISPLSSDTDGATIYYTLNGAKPAPFQTIGAAAKSTILYQEPFVLTAGKRTIKALAVTGLDYSSAVDIGLRCW